MKPPRIVLDTPSALVVAADSKGGRSAAMRDFAAQVLQRAPAFASETDLRALWIPSEGAARRAWQLFPWWPDPLSFIGRAANEGP